METDISFSDYMSQVIDDLKQEERYGRAYIYDRQSFQSEILPTFLLSPPPFLNI